MPASPCCMLHSQLPADPLEASNMSSTLVQALMQHTNYQKLSDADKLKLLEFKTAASASLVGLNPRTSDPWVYNSNFLIENHLFQRGLNIAMDNLRTVVSSYSYVTVESEDSR